MRLGLADYHSAYVILDKSHKLYDKDEGEVDNESYGDSEAWKKDKDLVRLRQDNGMMGQPVMLPRPLGKSVFCANRFQEWYSAFVMLFPWKEAKEWAFTGISEELEKRIGERDLKFAASSPDGTGIVYEEPDKPLMGIMESVDSTKISRDIGIGCNGAIPRTFNDFESFGIEMRQEFEWLLNVYIDVVLNTEKAKEQGFDSFPDVTILFPPNYQF